MLTASRYQYHHWSDCCFLVPDFLLCGWRVPGTSAFTHSMCRYATLSTTLLKEIWFSPKGKTWKKMLDSLLIMSLVFTKSWEYVCKINMRISIRYTCRGVQQHILSWCVASEKPKKPYMCDMISTSLSAAILCQIPSGSSSPELLRLKNCGYVQFPCTALAWLEGSINYRIKIGLGFAL